MDANTFLNSATFFISEDIKIEPLDPSKVETVSNVNIETVSFVRSETLDGLLQASATSDNSIDPDYASYQPLNEAGLMTAGNSTAQSAIGSNVNNSLGVQAQSLDSLRTAAQIVPPVENAEEQPSIVNETEELILGAQTTISNALIGIANNADKAEGAQKISAPTQLELGANSIYLISETMLHTSSPVVSVVAEVISNQSKVIQTTADLISENVKNKFSNVEGTNTSVATNKITTTIGREVSVASEINTTALTNHTINADVMETYAQSLIELRSTKSTRITADENIINQAGNISITASPGSKKTEGKSSNPGNIGETIDNEDGSKNFTATNAAGETVQFNNVQSDGNPKWKKSGAQLEGVASNPNPAKKNSAVGNITILANGEEGKGGSLTIVNNSQTTSSKESQTNLAKDINSLAENSVKTTGKKISSEAETLASMSSGQNIQFSTSSSMTLMTGGQTFQGLRKSDIGKMAKLADIGGPIELKEIPKLPKLPSGINAEGLESCIKKGKNSPFGNILGEKDDENSYEKQEEKLNKRQTDVIRDENLLIREENKLRQELEELKERERTLINQRTRLLGNPDSLSISEIEEKEQDILRQIKDIETKKDLIDERLKEIKSEKEEIEIEKKEIEDEREKLEFDKRVTGTIDSVAEGADAIISAVGTLLGKDKNEEDEEDPNFDDIKLNKKPKKKQEVEAPTVEEAGRREKEHPLPTGKDDASIGESLEEAGSSPQSVKLPKLGPLSETTSPTAQSSTKSQNEVMGSTAVIEGGTDIFTHDENDSEDILEENKPEDVKSSGDEVVDLFALPEGESLNQKDVFDVIENLLLVQGYTDRINATNSVKIKKLEEDYLRSIGKYSAPSEISRGQRTKLYSYRYLNQIVRKFKRDYSDPPYSSDLTWNKTIQESDENYYKHSNDKYFLEEWLDEEYIEGFIKYINSKLQEELKGPSNTNEVQTQNELGDSILGALNFYTEDKYRELAIKFTTENEGYHIVGDNSLPIKGLLLFPGDYYEPIIEWIKQKYNVGNHDVNKIVTIRGVNQSLFEHFNYYYKFEVNKSSVELINNPSSEQDFFPKGVGREWVDYFEEQILSRASIGGILGFAKNAVKYVKNNVNISDNIDDLKSGNTERVLGGLGKSLSSSLGGEYFTDASNIIKQSKFLQEVYKNVNTTFDPYVRDEAGAPKLDDKGNPVANPTNNLSGFIDAIDITGLQKVLTTATDIIGADKIQISQKLITGLQGIKYLDIFQREGYSPTVERRIVKVIKDSLGVSQQEAERFYYDTKGRIKLLLSDDLEGAFTGVAIDGVLSVLLGPANTQAIKDLGKLYSGTQKLILSGISKGKEALKTGKEIYNSAGDLIDSGKDLYTSIKAAPAIIATMNYYEVPTLNQVNTLLTCLDIKNNVKDVMQGVKDISKSINKLEELGGDLFNILENVIDNAEQGAGIVNERLESLVAQAQLEGPQTTPRIINESTNTNLLADTDLMSTLTNGLVSGSIAYNNNTVPGHIGEGGGRLVSEGGTVPGLIVSRGADLERTDSIQSEDDRFNSNDSFDSESPEGNVTQANTKSDLEELYVDINSSKIDEDNSDNICPPVYDAFAETNESSNPSDWEEKVTDEELFKTIETLPRLTQMYNSILELPTGQTIEGLTQEQIIDIKNTKINIKLDPCFIQVRLNAVEANIEVLELKKGVMLFKMQQERLLKVNNKNIMPGPNTLIQIYVEEFFEESKDRVLSVERNAQMYSPVTYNFKVINYKSEENIGIAQLIPTQSRIYLRNVEDNLIYNYSILDIGNKLKPQILDSYVVL